MKDQALDVVVFGATSFVGQILCRYLHERSQSGLQLRWGMAGRSLEKLEATRRALGDGAGALPLWVADANDPAALARLCKGTRVVVSTVGPYALYGEPLLRACVESGTDYCDLTGEVQWIRRMIRAFETQAQQSGARIVHCCGFDSIPSDLGVRFLQNTAVQRHGEVCTQVKMRVKRVRGGMSGGTLASMLNVMREVMADSTLRRVLADPYALCADTPSRRMRQPEVRGTSFDADFGAWTAPFIMAGINTRIVHRSHALAGQPYGQDFTYDEAMLMGTGMAGWMRATGLTLGLAGFMTATVIRPVRNLMQRYVLPAPGEGPTPQQQAEGHFDLRFWGRTSSGHELRSKVTGDRDPGYGSTAKMLGEAAACLALDVPKSRAAGGFWTPATLFGDRLIERLQTHAGLQFSVL
jgi:short subunit dehydrogenase-like uncharacterized protein